MQPYFFPYIGYWQLIHAADCFVLFDDVQYIRHGWINRNRILSSTGNWHYILVPLKKHSLVEQIKNVQAHSDNRWKELIIAQLSHYKKKAPYFNDTIQIVKESLFSSNELSIVAINLSILKTISNYLDINKNIIVSSAQKYNYDKVNDAGEWALSIAEQMNADEYINPVAGMELFDANKFDSIGIKLSFLKSADIAYSQRCPFVPSLSIIDVLMFNGIIGTKMLLKEYCVESVNA